MKYQCLLLISLALILQGKIANAEVREFTAKDMHSFAKISELTLNNGKDHVVYTVKKWDSATGIIKSNIQSRELKDGFPLTEVTDPSDSHRDSTPLFASEGNMVFFLRTEQGKTNAWYTVFPRREFKKDFQLTKYPVNISNLKIVGKHLMFSAEVWIHCETLQCSADEDAKVEARGANTWQIYDSLMVRHWDTWYTQGKASHVFYQEMNLDGMPKLVGDPFDLIKGKAVSSPPIEYGSEQFDMSPDGKYVAFSGLPRNTEEAWNTKWDIYIYEVGSTTEAQIITTPGETFPGRSQNPMFSSKSDKLAFMSMPRAGLEADRVFIYLYDVATKTSTRLPLQDTFKPYINSYTWKNDHVFILNTIDYGKGILYEYDYLATEKSKVFTKITNDKNVYELPLLTAIADKYYVTYNNFTSATVVASLDFTDRTTAKVEVISDLNIDAMMNFDLSQADSFEFPGGNKETVQGWIMMPYQFEKDKKYPLAYLIHGGPEGAWDPGWSYRWNPQLWANRGYVVVMVNFHGSSGMGIDFQDKVRNNWGTLPYQDLMLGIDYVLSTYQFIDKDRMGAAGASFGGFMVNWIQGNSHQFKALVTHDGDFNEVAIFYSTEEMWYPFAENCPLDKQGCKPYESAESRASYEKFSPEMRVKNWKTPHLIIHGSQDFRVPISEGISAFTALQIKGVPSRFLRFPEENHWVQKPENSIVWYNEVLGWLDKYVKA